MRIPTALEDKEDVKEDVKELVRQHLSTQVAVKWLLIVDNVDDIDVLFGPVLSKGIVDYLPESEDSLTVFTSCRQEIAESLVSGDVLELGKMSEEEVVTFLKRLLVRKDLAQDSATTKLLTKLDYLPLAIA